MLPPIHTGTLADEDVSLHQQLKAVIRARMLTAVTLHLQSFEWTIDESAVLAAPMGDAEAGGAGVGGAGAGAGDAGAGAG
jgi:hypothetical protein